MPHSDHSPWAAVVPRAIEVGKQLGSFAFQSLQMSKAAKYERSSSSSSPTRVGEAPFRQQPGT